MSNELGKIETEFFPIEGGLDLVSPAIALNAGRCIDAQNYEIDENGGGYRRIDGFEAFDGKPSPTLAPYYILIASITGTINVNDTVTGATSGATMKVLGIFGSNIVGATPVGTFIAGETLTDSGSVGTVTVAPTMSSAPLPSDDADYALLAANNARLLIGKVPGSGKIRGIWCYNDIWYAFRDNAGGTAGNMYKSSSSGWIQVSFGREILFNTGVGQINVGDTVTGATSGATGVAKAVLLRTGAWSGSGVGSIVFASVTGAFQNAEALQVSAVTKATSTSVDTAITRQPGGRLEFDNINFTGSTATQKMYGVDGVNLCFEFDGTTYVPIRTGMTADTPSHVKGHKFYLFLSFLGSVQFSALGAPYSWTTVLGAGEIATGDPVTNFIQNGGTLASGSTLQILTQGKLHTLYGSSSSDFKLVTSIADMGYSPYTAQLVSNNAYGMTARGIQSIITTLTFGDFDYASISHELQPYIKYRKGLEIASTSLKDKNQYRVYFSDNFCLSVGLEGDKVSGIMSLNYGMPVRCITTAQLTTGKEVTMFGSDDGYIYQDNTGTSFNGSTIEAWVRLPFNHTKSPRVRKKYRRAVLEGKVSSYSSINFSYNIGYGSFNVQPSLNTSLVLNGAGGYWDQFLWDQFIWDAQVIADPTIPLDGTEKNISILFYSNRAQDQSHTIQGVTLIYSPRRLER